MNIFKFIILQNGIDCQELIQKSSKVVRGFGTVLAMRGFMRLNHSLLTNTFTENLILYYLKFSIFLISSSFITLPLLLSQDQNELLISLHMHFISFYAAIIGTKFLASYFFARTAYLKYHFELAFFIHTFKTVNPTSACSLTTRNLIPCIFIEMCLHRL